MTSRNSVRPFFEAQVIRATDDCIDWSFSTTADGYGQMKMDGRLVKVHIEACTRFHGPRPPGMQVRHWVCGRAICFNPRHLCWGTPQEQADDKTRHGTHARGVRNGVARLTEDDVRLIRERVRGAGVRRRHGAQKAIADELGVARTTVHAVVTGKSWSWVE